MSKEEQIKILLERGVENVYPSRSFLEKGLKSGKKLTLYLGIDPTGKLHAGHMVALRKMRQFQDLGHKIIILIGDFTGQIGDPTDKAAVRKVLTKKQVLENAKNYKKLISKIIDFSGKNPADMKFNSKWLEKLTFKEVVELAANFTVQQMIVRDMFEKRIKENKPIHLHEFFYPLMQAYDSVVMDVDGEVGGNDQTFNMLAGRDLMKSLKGKEKFVLTMKLLEDGTGKKMGKTDSNGVDLEDSPEEIFGKVMSWADNFISIGSEILTDLDLAQMKKMESKNPRDAKFLLASEVVKNIYSAKEAEKAGERFNTIFREKKTDVAMPVVKVKSGKTNIVELVFATGQVSSKSEARRLVQQGAISIDDQKVTGVEDNIDVVSGIVVKIGKHRLVKIG